MSATIIDGKQLARSLCDTVGTEVGALHKKHGITPGLAVVLVGENPASEVYVRNKVRETKQAGMNSFEHRLPNDTDEKTLLALVQSLNDDAGVHGILVQLPLPSHIDEALVLNTIVADKDVDGFHPVNTGRLWSGLEGLIPCTPLGCWMMAKDALDDLSGKNAVIVGRSNIVGKPMAALLLKESATVTIAHSRTRDLPELCRSADILVAAVGRPRMVRGDWIKEGACVLDVGINRIEENGKKRLVGDVHFDEAVKRAKFITPVPGGVGPMTIACLLHNTLKAAKLIHDV